MNERPVPGGSSRQSARASAWRVCDGNSSEQAHSTSPSSAAFLLVSQRPGLYPCAWSQTEATSAGVAGGCVERSTGTELATVESSRQPSGELPSMMSCSVARHGPDDFPPSDPPVGAPRRSCAACPPAGLLSAGVQQGWPRRSLACARGGCRVAAPPTWVVDPGTEQPCPASRSTTSACRQCQDRRHRA